MSDGFKPPAKPMTVYSAGLNHEMQWPKGMLVVSLGEYMEAISMLNKVLAFFNPTHDRPEAADVYCEGFKMCHGYFPPAYRLNRPTSSKLPPDIPCQFCGGVGCIRCDARYAVSATREEG